MPYRTFEDATGTEWQVWDIVPRLTERRHVVLERRVDVAPIAFADRRSDERRLTHLRRAVLSGSYAHGWLCFDSGVDKKRLSPIPADWLTCSDEAVESYLRSSENVMTSRRSFGTLSAEDPRAEAG